MADTPHIVDTLIEERAEQLMRHPRLWRLVKKLMYPVLGYQRAIETVDSVQHMGGREIFDHLVEMLRMDVQVSGVEFVPKSGRAIVMPNHPAGIADGVAVYAALRDVRPDMVFFANRDAVRAAASLYEMIIPVEWMEQRRDHAKTRDTVRQMLRAFRDERLVVIFPSGRLARPTPIGLVERPWLTSAVSLAQKYASPIVPMHVRGHNSFVYYLLWFVNTELKDMTLFRELLLKTGQRYRLTIGEAIPPNGDVNDLTVALRRYVVRDLKRGVTRFEGAGADLAAAGRS